MEKTLPQRLEEYIADELSDHALYQELVHHTTDPEYQKLLTQFAQDEHRHATVFKRLYHMLTGCCYEPGVEPPEVDAPFREVLRQRVLSEAHDMRKYSEEALLADDRNRLLKEAFCMAQTDENVHALSLLQMLSE